MMNLLQIVRTAVYYHSTWIISTATTLQTWKISSLKSRLYALLRESRHNNPSIMLYAKPLTCPEEGTNDINGFANNGNETTQKFMSSHLCYNKSLAKLGDLLWSHGDARLCSIYPQQQIDVSNWLAYQHESPFLPLLAPNIDECLLCKDFKMHVLIEADFDTYNPILSTRTTKLQDYGLIVSWTAETNLNIIMETDLDLVAKLATSVMQGQYCINNGLVLTRILSVLITGNPCAYHCEQSYSLPDKRLTGTEEWELYIKKLRLLSSAARLVSQQNKPQEVEDTPGVTIYPYSETSTVQIPMTEKLQDEYVTENSRSYAALSKSIESLSSAITTLPEDVDSEEFNLQISHIVPESNDAPPVEVEIINMVPTKEKECEKIESAPTSDDQNVCIATLEAQPSLMFQLKSVSPKGKITEYSSYHKPPNVLIYSESAVSLNNVKTVLDSALRTYRYTVYALSREEAKSDAWMNQAALVVVCGNVGTEIGTQLIEYIVRGGKLLALCSDTLHTLLPSFKTAEVREHELVHFSYGKWKHVRMMHHIFCYQASPVRTRFSHDSEDISVTAMSPPVSATVKDNTGKSHSFEIKVLGTEETWHTPSIILATLPNSEGRAIFSQIHLEADPSQYEFEENKFNALKQSNTARLEIFNDLLNAHLNMEINTKSPPPIQYKAAFFLGRHELKLEVMDKLKEKLQPNDILKTPNLEIQFCRKSADIRPASSSYLPVLLHQCPDNFSTIEYFESLKTKELGRLVIYADVLTSSMDLVMGQNYRHGFVVISRQQTRGKGRGRNVWLSPEGCAMFTMQLHIPKNSQLGIHISILQHLIIVAVVSAITSVPGYEGIDLRLKWPNDIYAGKSTKIGGVIVTSQMDSSNIICNAGVGVNLSNKIPTCCINSIIEEYNKTNKTKLEPISYERFFALVFSEIEYLMDIVQSGNMTYFFNTYYKYWMHTGAEVTVISRNDQSEVVTILGIDDYGFLKVQANTGNVFSVQPDGNSFDLLKGLIAPK